MINDTILYFQKRRQQFIDSKRPFYMLMHGASEVKLLRNLCLCGAIFYNYWSEVEMMDWMVRDDLELPDDGGEISKSQGRGWQFESQL